MRLCRASDPSYSLFRGCTHWNPLRTGVLPRKRLALRPRKRNTPDDFRVPSVWSRRSGSWRPTVVLGRRPSPGLPRTKDTSLVDRPPRTLVPPPFPPGPYGPRTPSTRTVSLRAPLGPSTPPEDDGRLDCPPGGPFCWWDPGSQGTEVHWDGRETHVNQWSYNSELWKPSMSARPLPPTGRLRTTPTPVRSTTKSS